MAAWGYEFYLLVLKVVLTRSFRSPRERYFQHEKIKFVSLRDQCNILYLFLTGNLKWERPETANLSLFFFSLTDQSPGTPTDHATKHISSSFQPMLDLQRFQQFVAQERRRDVENQSPSDLTNERGSCVPGTTARASCKPFGTIWTWHRRPGTVWWVAMWEQHGSGLDHVAKHGIVCEGPTKPLGNSEPYFHLQAPVPLPTDAKATSVVRPNPEGRIEHVASGGGMALEADHLSEPSSFLSQKSTEIVAGGPGFLVPGNLVCFQKLLSCCSGVNCVNWNHQDLKCFSNITPWASNRFGCNVVTPVNACEYWDADW